MLAGPAAKVALPTRVYHSIYANVDPFAPGGVEQDAAIPDSVLSSAAAQHRPPDPRALAFRREYRDPGAYERPSRTSGMGFRERSSASGSFAAGKVLDILSRDTEN